ncbi:FxLYD domain-containing protein [Kitasatospora indigofera]|uniref:FxLYD domain-containing protein n=1 Tax=Kitasatospora indigofera TaxID=67307 RepID=UPI00364544D5
MRRTTIAVVAAAAVLGLAACDPVANSTTAKSTAAPVPATTAGAPAAAAPAPAGEAAAPAPAPAAAGDGDKLKDVEITGCVVDAVLHWPSAEVKITNHSSKASNYMVQIEFLDATGTRIAEGLAATNGLAPGQASVQKAQGASEAKGKVSCKVIDVTRYAAP